MTTIIRICTGCSCSKFFSKDNLKLAEKLLGIKAGATTKDGKFRLEKTGCLSHCESAPNVMFCSNDGPLSAIMIEGTIETNLLPHRFEEKLKKLIDSN